MKDAIFKYLPIVVGVLLGVLVVAPPALLGLSWPVRVAIGIPVVALLFVGFTVFMISSALPDKVGMTPIDQKLVSDQMMDVFVAFQDAGFQLAGPPLRIETAPPAVLVPLVDRTGEVYGTIYRTGTQPPKTSCDVVTIFAEPEAGLTTGPMIEGASLPASPRSFFQVFPNADIATLYARHLEALEYLKRQGLRVKPASAQDFPGDFRRAISHQRKHFFTNPLWHAIVTIYRSSAGTTPHVGPIQQQLVARKSLEALRTGGRS
jgi:hypothetical protein